MIYSPPLVRYFPRALSARRPNETRTHSMLCWLSRRSFAVVPCLLAGALLLASCDTLRSWTGGPDEADRRPAPTKPAPPTPQKPASPPVTAPLPLPGPVIEGPAATIEQPVKVALLLPLSGSLSKLGTAMADAAQMAMFDLADRRFKLMLIDDKGTPGGAAEAARQATAEGAQLILGPLLAASVRAVAPIAAGAGVPVVAFSSDRKVAGPGVHIIGFTPEMEVQRVVEYAIRNGRTRMAVLAPDNPYGSAVVDALRRTAVANGAQVTRIEGYDPRTQEFTANVRRLAGLAETPVGFAAEPAPPLPFDTLLLAEGGPQLRAIAAALTAAGIRPPAVQLLGTGKWDEPGVGAEPALVGAWFAAPSPAGREDFEERYRRTFGQAPPRLATLAYDATALAAVLARGPQSAPFTEASLTDPNGFYGRDGLFRLTADGVVERRLAVLRVEPRGPIVIDEPPRSFAAGT